MVYCLIIYYFKIHKSFSKLFGIPSSSRDIKLLFIRGASKDYLIIVSNAKYIIITSLLIILRLYALIYNGNKQNAILNDNLPSYYNAKILDYFQIQFEFLSGSSKTYSSIDFIYFDNYLGYPLQVSRQVFKTLSASKEYLTQSEFINGMVIRYNGIFQERLLFLIQLFDFDNDDILHFRRH